MNPAQTIQSFVATSDGCIETITGEARSAEVKAGDVFVVTQPHALGFIGKLKIHGKWIHQPGLSGKKTDTTPIPASLGPEVLLRKQQINGDSDFFANFVAA